MNLLSLEAVLLFALSIPVVMGYRILPVEGTPYWLFGILFALLTGNILLSLHPGRFKKNLERIKGILLWLILAIVVGGTTWTAIVDRSKTAPVYGVHDIILQQEAAMRYLLEGKNPYKETYFSTPVEEFNYDEPGNPDAVNPALYHFVMPPWYLLFPFPIYFISIPILGYFDSRMALLIAMVGLLLVLFRWFKSRPLGLLAITLTALSPATIDYFIEGRSDVFALFWFVWSLYLLEKRWFLWSAIIFGLALMSKQTIWFAIPFYVLFAWVSLKAYKIKRPHDFVGMIFSTAITVLVLTGPFLLWDARAFVDSTVRFLNGTTVYSYPVGGYGFGMLFYQMGIIKDLHAYYPFIFWQLLFALPALFWSLRWILGKPAMSRLLIGYALTLTIFWYFSRYFNNSHLGYLSSIFVIGVLKAQDEEEL